MIEPSVRRPDPSGRTEIFLQMERFSSRDKLPPSGSTRIMESRLPLLRFRQSGRGTRRDNKLV
jgi:hypothetical protein